MPDLQPLDPIEEGVRRIHRLSVATGFGPLTVQEIYQILKKATPRKAINNADQTRGALA